MFLQINKQLKSGIAGSVLLSSALILTACGGGDNSASNGNTNTNALANSGAPEMSEDTNSRVYRSGSRQETIVTVTHGDKVQLAYEMFNRTTGDLVESSEDLTYVIGNQDDVKVPIPLANALEDSLVGETYWIYFPPGVATPIADLEKEASSYTVKFKIVKKLES